MILIDYSPVLISCAHSATSWEKDKNETLAKGKQLITDYPDATVGDIHFFRMLNTLRMVNSQYRGKYGRPVICVDRKPYWRSTIFPYYKKNRKPMDKEMNWELFFNNGDDILNACRNIFGWKVIDEPGLEGDDIIGVLIHEFPNERHMIVSPDGDFKQLQVHKNVEQYDTIRKKKIIEKDPKKWLREKIISGDKKDGIPNIVSTEDVFVSNGRYQNPIKRRDRESWVATENPMFFCNQEMLERFQMNQRLLDMTLVPDEQKKIILDAFRREDTKRGNVYGYFAENGITRFIEQLDDFR